MSNGNTYHVADEALAKAYDHTLMRRLMSYLRPHVLLVSFTLLLVILAVVARLASPVLIGLTTDVAKFEIEEDKPGLRSMTEVFAKPVNDRIKEIDENAKNHEERIKGRRRLLKLFGIVYLLSVLFRWIMQYGQGYLVQYLGQKVVYSMRMGVFTHLQKLSLKFYDKNPVGRLVTRVANDIHAISHMFSEALITMIGSVVMLLCVIVAMFALNWRLALLATSVIIPLFFIAVVFRHYYRIAFRAVRAKLAAINAFISESLLGMKTIQMFHQEERKINEFDKINDEYLKEMFSAIRYSTLIRPFATVIGSIGVSLIIWYGGRAVLNNDPTITLGMLVTFFWLSMLLLHPITDITQKYQLIQAAMASSERVFKLLDNNEIIENAEDPKAPKVVLGKIEFQNVWFRYSEDGDWVLKDVSFIVEPGESVAIVGETGAGKSSIISLLLRFYNIQKGRILLDGMDIREIEKTELRRFLGLVLQDVFIFAGEVAYNIRLGGDIPMDDVERCARYVNAHHFIEKMDGGYAADVQERGSALSVGQRQLLAFARALCFDPNVLILDEATSNIDMETELLIRDALSKLIKGRTSIIVAHRLSTIQNVDRIVVMHKGEVMEIGTHRELLRERGLFYRFYQLQSVEALRDEE